jgi:hypothetical protein
MCKDVMSLRPLGLESRRRWLGRLVGFLLVAAGISLFYFLTPVAASHGLLAGWLAVWPIVALIGVGGLLVLEFNLITSLRMLAMALGALVPWSLILLVPLPGNSQGLLAILVAAVGVFLYHRYHLKRKSSEKGGEL